MSDHSSHLFTKDVLNQLKKQGKDFTAHSIFAPSSSAMWANCAGSLLANAFAPDQPTVEAAEGTVAHFVAELWLKHGERPDHLLGETKAVDGFEIEITKDMLDHLAEYVSWCLSIPGVHRTERRVDFSDLTPIPNQKGTADYYVMQPRRLIVNDLKYGEGIQVYAEDNTQGLLYAYGVFKEYDALYRFKEIVIQIGQPRFDHWDSWAISRKELLEWAAWLKERAYAAWKPNAPRTPSAKACQWCKVRNDCTAYVVFLARMNDGIWENIEQDITVQDMQAVVKRLDSNDFEPNLPDPGKLSLEHKLKLTKYAKLFTSWFDKIETEINNRVLAGEHIPEKKIIEGRSSRKITNIELATETLLFYGVPEEKVRPRGIIGITEAESELIKAGVPRKLLPKVLNSFVAKPPGRPTVVDSSHPAPPLIGNMESAFQNLNDDP